MSCNQPNKLSRTAEQTLKEPPSVNIQENASNQIRTSTSSSDKAKQLFPPFYAFEKGSTSNTCKAQQNAIPEVVYISASTSNACLEQQNLTPKVATKKDIMDVKTLFGGKVIVFGGDFRQTLPVVRNGKKEDFIHQSLLYSNIWNDLEKLHFSENMRARTDPSFCEYLLRIGNGKETPHCENKIEIPNSLIIPFTTEEQSLDTLFNVTYPDLCTFPSDSSAISSRVILTTKNDFVNEINDMLIRKFPERATTYVATDETVEPNDQSQFEDFLHTLHPPGLPPYKLTLKENCPVMLLRNLNPSEGLCNGTRLTCCDLKTHVISAKIESGDFKNTHVFIPRIPLLTSQDEKIPIQFKRTQFPLRLCFAMTINKAQGQTLDFVGIYLREPVFSHGQLYVALSRAKSSKSVKILIRPLLQTVVMIIQHII